MRPPGPVAQEDDADAHRLRLVDPVAEEVVGVGAAREVAEEEAAVRGERLGQVGGEGRAAGEFGERGGEAAACRARGVPFGPDQGQGVGELGGEGLGGVAVGRDGRAAAFGGLVEAVGDLLQGLGRRGEQAGAVQEGEQRGEQGPQGAGRGGRGGFVVLVRGGRHRYEEAVCPGDGFAQRGRPRG